MNQQKNYAQLLLKEGVNLQKDQMLVINATTEVDYFVEILVEEAYKMGAKEVEVMFSNDKVGRLKYEYAPMEIFETVPPFRVDHMMYYANQGAAMMRIVSSDPDILKGIDSNKIAAFNKANGKAMTPYRELSMANKLRWQVAAVPGKAWANKLFPNSENAIDQLWNMILKCSYAEGANPSADWASHVQTVVNNATKLNALDLESLHFKASNGTDILVGLCEDYIWGGGDAKATDGIQFSPNIPSEEVFTAPHAGRVNGKVVASLPLVYSGSIIDGFEITFKDGMVVDYKAEVGEEVLKTIFEIDDGAKGLGEVALVPFSSPINKTGMLFYNTLFDENASCHFAFGAGYPTTVDMTKNTEKTIEEKGLNQSKTHIDFMFGTEDMDCVGIKKDGTKVQIMKNGEIIL